MSHSLTFATWFWLLIPALICLGVSIFRYQLEQRHSRRRRLHSVNSRPHSKV